ncbi:MAG: hypothetical protein WCD40_00665 [Candidatus Acidiferrales bacterium]
MPGFRRWHPSEEPFSYTKLCTAIPILVFGTVLLISMFKGDKWLPSSVALSVVIVGLIAAAIYFLFLKVVWLLLPGGIRARIPYDRKEASESKGDVKSFWDIRKLVVPTRRN